MIESAHLGQSSSQRVSPPDWDIWSSSFAQHVGLLGNEKTQLSGSLADTDGFLWTVAYRDIFRPDSKLDTLKKRTFTPVNREERIATSLAALEEPQTIILTLEQWKSIAEAVEDEDDEY
jgi:hypothetical protein